MSATGVAVIASSISDILGKFFPDKTQIERDTAARELAALTAQTDIDKAEAASSDPLQHWRGGMGWVCVAGFAYNFIIEPIVVTLAAVVGHPLALAPLDIAQLTTLTAGMLGLAGAHVVGQINGVK